MGGDFVEILRAYWLVPFETSAQGLEITPGDT